MTERQELGSLEAMLFAHAEPVETARLADALRLDADEVTTLLQKLQKRYDEQESGMVILYFEPDRWQMTTRPYYGEMVKRILDTRRNAPLSPAALEVLAVIAYNQPVSRSFIEQVRGVDSSSTVTKLLDKGLIGGGPPGPARQAGSFPGHGHISARLWYRQSGRPATASRRGCRERRAGGDGRRRRSAGMEVIAYGHSVVPSPTDRLGAAGGALAAVRRPADTAGRSVCVPPGQRAGHGLLRTATLHALAAQGQPEALKKPASAAPPGKTVRKTADGEQASVTVEVKPAAKPAQTVARQPAAQGKPEAPKPADSVPAEGADAEGSAKKSGLPFGISARIDAAMQLLSNDPIAFARCMLGHTGWLGRHLLRSVRVSGLDIFWTVTADRPAPPPSCSAPKWRLPTICWLWSSSTSAYRVTASGSSRISPASAQGSVSSRSV